MAEQNSTGDGIEMLWPTVLMRRTLPGAEIANQAPSTFGLKLEDANTMLTILSWSGYANASTALSPIISARSA